MNIKRIKIGEEFKGKFDFRETCFGICEINNKILLVKKDNQYSLVGGGREKNESMEECLRREFLEETGYQLKIIKPFVIVDCFWLAANKYPMESLANIFIVEVDETTKIDALEKEEHQLEFVDRNKVLDLLPLPYHKRAIKHYLEK